ncbi:iron transporter [Herbaspirillum sp. RTI4]|uniref:iron transporter n=1 Tax=Herbaspirillum sp. RTI4 TaxID=3048640 RepID=UPI002AB4BB8C|nr:iron transporter [Herbaspirillum sp. RTI4]MDY7578862.1 iron transporter [Herbaspirillum sp. RTI4]MEA9983005.1 iron transporter [Herbaspirillum sp. RTI4]
MARIHPLTSRAAQAILLTCIAIGSAQAAEYPIGKPQILNGLEVNAVYLQPVKMEPDGMMRKAEESDIHLEADIHAVAKNPNGFAEGDWMPYLVIKFELSKVGSPQVIRGDLMPMVASDGPHYGDNVKMAGPGKYKLKFIISPPSANEHAHFGRHVDKETGVSPWFKPFELNYDLVFAGVGKKGGY